MGAGNQRHRPAAGHARSSNPNGATRLVSLFLFPLSPTQSLSFLPWDNA